MPSTTSPRLIIGLDFGTTNSVLAAHAPGTDTTRTLRVATGDTFRSVLCFWNDEHRGRLTLRHAAGPAAIDAYLDDPHASRLVMSPKTYLASASFTATNLLGRVWTLEALIALFLRDLLQAADIDPADAHIVAGRPVRFAGDTPDDALGERRLRAAMADAGIISLDLALEPEAAGYRFARALGEPATLLVGDFGGGTSDFSILQVTPNQPIRTIARAGIGIAGDAFDARLMEHVVAPLLGRGSTYAPWGNALPVPAEWYSAFARWHRLSLMNTPRMLRDIEDVRRTAEHPGRLDHLRRLIEDEQGYALYRAVSDAKAALSTAPSATLRFGHDGFTLERDIARAEFEAWIAPDIARIDATIAQALEAAALPDAAIDRVFLTGGTAFVPAVRALFERRFGADRLSGGGEFVSVAEGLALIGAERARAT